MYIECVQQSINGRDYTFGLTPPLEVPEYPLADDLGYGLPATLARHLVPGEGQAEVRQRLARRLFIMAEVAPNPQTYARHLTELTRGNPVVHVI